MNNLRNASLIALIALPQIFALGALKQKNDSTKTKDSLRNESHANPLLPDTNASKTRLLPYLEKIDQRGNISVWIVDGTYVRNHLDVEFTNFGQHYVFDCIPKNEFWLDKEVQPDEQKFFIEHLVIEHKLMVAGVPYDRALEKADRAELAERKKAGDVARLTTGGSLPDPRKVHQRLWKTIESGVSIWIVDGRLVRSVFDVDFTEGGHDHVYEFVPENEVWIDNDLEEAERPYVLLHELHERNLMSKGWTYSKAHESSSVLELHCRKNPNELHTALAKEGWE
jgi:hypothetical protein